MHRSQNIFPQRRQCVPRLAAVEASKAFPQTHSFMSRHEVHSMATSSKRSFGLCFPEANMIRLWITGHTVEYSFSSKGSFPIIFFAAYWHFCRLQLVFSSYYFSQLFWIFSIGSWIAHENFGGDKYPVWNSCLRYPGKWRCKKCNSLMHNYLEKWMQINR